MPDARDIVEAAHLDPSLYNFERAAEGSLCLLAFGRQWRVFVSERGQRYEEQLFESEDEACVHFLKRIFLLAART